MGHFLPSADAVVANLDEPVDEGVIVEISYARIVGQHVVGFRTDARSPFGSISDPLGGLHFFPAYQCDVLLRDEMPCKDPNAADAQLTRLAERIHACLSKTLAMAQRQPAFGSFMEDIIEGARLLFSDIDDIHSPEGLTEIADRYVRNAAELQRLGPRMG